MPSTICVFIGAPFGTCHVQVENPLRQIENLHGLEFKRVEPHVGTLDFIAYEYTGHRTEWVRPPTYRSRSERTGKKQPKYDTSLEGD